jgi:hypothetical protein
MMNQVLLGGAIPFFIALLIYALRKQRAGLPFLLLTPAAMALGILWAVIPDLPRLLGRHDLYLRWAQDPRMDLFFWHYSIDRVELESSWYAVGLLCMAATLLAIAWRELARKEDD